MMLGIYGASGFGREILPLARRVLAPTDRIIFIDDNPDLGLINGCEVQTLSSFEAQDCEKSVVIAVADAITREKLTLRCADNGIETRTLIDPSVIVGDHNQIGGGAILCANVIITSNATIGQQFHANIFSYVAHDCVIGDYVTFAPRVNCNGNVTIGDHAYIGTGATLRQGTPDCPLVIGAGAIIGMGAVVTKDVPPGEVWVGNPAARLGASERLR